MSFELIHKGPYTVVHHQYYQMVDLLIQHWRRTMSGLNPYALPHSPPTPKRDAESTNNNVNNTKNAESTKWHTCKTKKGRGYKNNNNKKKEKKTRLFGNRFSRLAEMVQDDKEIKDVLETAVDEEVKLNMIKEKTTRNAYNVDSADMNMLDAEIQKYVDQDHNEDIQNKINLNENADDNENVDNHVNNTSDKTESNEESEYDSEKERFEYRLMHPDSDSECLNENSEVEYFNSDESIKSNLERWYNNRSRHMAHPDSDTDSECLNEDSEIDYLNSDDSIKSNLERWCNNRPKYRCKTYSE